MLSSLVGPAALLSVFLVGPLLSGCGGVGGGSGEEDQHLRVIAAMYNQCRMQNFGRPPANEAEFKKYIQDNAQKILDQAGIDSVDELFVSEHDGENFVVVYGKEATRGPGIVIYEKKGMDGQRYIAFSGGSTKKIDEAQFSRLMPKAGQ